MKNLPIADFKLFINIQAQLYCNRQDKCADDAIKSISIYMNFYNIVVASNYVINKNNHRNAEGFKHYGTEQTFSR